MSAPWVKRPDVLDLVRELRDALGLSNAARPDSPFVVWRETLDHVRALRVMAE